jgi:predicted permease
MMTLIRIALRRLIKSPGYALAFIVTLGLGIGATAAVFSLLSGVILKPLPHEDGERLVYLRQSAELSGIRNTTFSVPEIDDLRERSATLRELAEHSVLGFTLLGVGEPQRVTSGIVTGNYFGVMGLEPVLGRAIGPSDEGPNAAPVMMLTYDYWGRVFGFDPQVLGRVYEVNGRSVEIIGVLAPTPPYPARTDVYVNIASSPHHLGAEMNRNRGHRMTEVFGRLASGATVESAKTEVAAIAAAIRAEHPDAYDASAGYAITVTGLKDELTQDAGPVLWMLLATAGFVLVIACANVANLTLARVVARERDLVIRAALGASGRMLRQDLLVENLLLAAAGAAFAFVIAQLGFDALVAFVGRLTSRATEIVLDWRVFVFAMAIAAFAALLFAWLPRLPRSGCTSARPVGDRAAGDVVGRRVQRSLVVAQIAVSFVLLVGAGLFGRTFIAMQSIDPGIDTENVLVVDLPANLDNGRSFADTRVFYDTIVERVRSVPNVEEAGLGMTTPLVPADEPFFSSVELKIDGQGVVRGAPRPRAALRTATPGYFRALGVELLAGRFIESIDGPETQRVVVVSDSFAERHFPNQDPIGQRVAWDNELFVQGVPAAAEWHTIVGVVRGFKDDAITAASPEMVFHAFAQLPLFTDTLFVKSAGDAEALATPVRQAIRSFAPDQAVENVRTIAVIRSLSIAPERLNAMLVGGFALLALIIAALGVFSVLSFSVAQRTREFGIRSALGATHGAVLALVLREGIVLAGAGLLIGGLAAVGLARFVESFLLDVSAFDPLTFFGVGATLAVVAFAACWLPARGAARVAPMEALRGE